MKQNIHMLMEEPNFFINKKIVNKLFRTFKLKL